MKRRLYRYLRHKFEDDWVNALDLITNAINHTENSGIDGLIPAEVNDSTFDPVVRKARQIVSEHRKPLTPQKDVYKVGQYVYIDFDTVCLSFI